MSKLYVPDGAWLVCSDGMKKQQIKVTSQSKVTIAGGYLKATVDDRPGGNFMCAKMVVGGAILGAIVAAALVAGSIVTGGALAVAAGAAIGAGVGLGASAIPSVCGMLLKDWMPYDNDVLTVGKRPLLENSTIPCFLGGKVMILYSEKAADEFTDINIGRTTINTVGVIALSYILYPAVAAIGSTAVAAKGIFATFGSGAGFNYLGGIALSTGTAYGIGWGIDQTKGGVYSVIPTGDGNTVKTYVDGFESNPENIVDNYKLSNSNGDKTITDHTNDIGGATGVGKGTIGDRTSTYYQQTTVESIRLDDIEEHGAVQTSSANRIDDAISGRNPNVGDPYRIVTNSDYGGRYQVIEENQFTTNSQYDPLRRSNVPTTLGSSIRNTYLDQKGLPTFSRTQGPNGGGIVMGLLQDVYKGITNFILKDQAEDLIKTLQNEEAKARKNISVIAGKD